MQLKKGKKKNKLTWTGHMADALPFLYVHIQGHTEYSQNKREGGISPNSHQTFKLHSANEL